MAETGNPAAESADLQACVDRCVRCARVCLDMATNACLTRGGRHIHPPHIALMLGCADVCAATARFLIMHTVLHHKPCAVCADVCEACAVSCQQLDGLDECVGACRACAALCRRVAIGASEEL